MTNRGFRCLLIAGAAAALGVTLAWPTEPTEASAATIDVKATTAQASFIKRSAAAAAVNRTAYGVPPSVTIAQAILESNWGQSPLAKNENNYFGMKCSDNVPGPIAKGCATYPTKECDASGCYDTPALFRSYWSVADSFRDHDKKLFEASRYDPAFNYPHDADQFIREVHKAGYATDPNYSEKVIKLMRDFDLYRFN